MKTLTYPSFWFILLFQSFAFQSFGLFGFKPDSIQILVNQSQLKLPGESFEIGVVSYHKKGKIRRTTGYAGGNVFWFNYKVEVIGGDHRNGSVYVNHSLVPSKGKYIMIRIYPRKKLHLLKTVLLPLNYETELEFNPANDFKKAPGCVIKGVLFYKFDNGMYRSIKNFDHGDEAKMFHLSGDGGQWEKGKFIITTDFLSISDHRVTVDFYSLRNPSAETHYSFILDYKNSYVLSFSGASGIFGMSGNSGDYGLSGRNGGHGTHGEDGSHGYDGPNIGAWVDSYYDTILKTNLLYVYTRNFDRKSENFYLINPDGGSLTIISSGGNGGSGGVGGDGGNGGNGNDGPRWVETKYEKKIVQKQVPETIKKKVKKTRTNSEGKTEEYEQEIEEVVMKTIDVEEIIEIKIEHQGPGENGGNGGFGGDGGNGGNGGWGGNIELYFTEDAMAYRSVIHVKNPGGSGGYAGSGGSGGSGGNGGRGCPSGINGSSGYNGFAGLHGVNGRDGMVTISTTCDFFAKK